MCVDASALEVSRTAGVPHIDGPHRRFVRSRVCTCYDARLPVWCRRARCANCAEVCTKCAERRCGARFRPLLRCAASPRRSTALFLRTVPAHRSCTPFVHAVPPRRAVALFGWPWCPAAPACPPPCHLAVSLHPAVSLRRFSVRTPGSVGLPGDETRPSSRPAGGPLGERCGAEEGAARRRARCAAARLPVRRPGSVRYLAGSPPRRP